MLPNGTKVKIVFNDSQPSSASRVFRGRVGYIVEGQVMLDGTTFVSVNDNDLQVLENPVSAEVINGLLNVGDYAAWPGRQNSALWMVFGQVILIEKVVKGDWFSKEVTINRITIRSADGKKHKTDITHRVVKCTSI